MATLTLIETDIHASGGIRTRNPKKRAAAEPRLRPRSLRDRRLDIWSLHFLRTVGMAVGTKFSFA